ncbi:GNAT family N-acetyltransferase [Streptomyces sp. NPDC096068]|uniref:GNAT family N-acetyltransferase n=1 Tax=Streptomyces sp. NPDC096068 TaxID=3155424 RepID=UPI003330039C
MTDQAGLWAEALAEEIRATYPSARLELGIDHGPYLVLFSIVLPESRRGTGIGSRVMQHITAAADLQGVPVTLSPSDAFGGDVVRLEAFYRRFGFITNTWRGEVEAPRESMVRVPPGSASAGEALPAYPWHTR